MNTKISKAMHKSYYFLEVLMIFLGGTNDLQWFLRILPGSSKQTVVCDV